MLTYSCCVDKRNEWNREKKKNYIWVSRVHSSLLLAFKLPFQSYENFCKITKVLLLHWDQELKATQVHTHSWHLPHQVLTTPLIFESKARVMAKCWHIDGLHNLHVYFLLCKIRIRQINKCTVATGDHATSLEW